MKLGEVHIRTPKGGDLETRYVLSSKKYLKVWKSWKSATKHVFANTLQIQHLDPTEEGILHWKSSKTRRKCSATVLGTNVIPKISEVT
eukprot:CAMPEP_0196652022 /NCGR_PEP_ID=MMETSP1086-20130531/1226_1 /TAXON_ID=77921 /ORGANISM="Cyanoptyche  gloeocystis , Strain SAG4.97" /LENGTH=87 /DNA_ID=CAMNT_0041982357 /DNA_START=496 /DNA_END=759 /DNA_ORIENTATION=-